MDKLFTFIFIFAFGFLSPVLLAQEESNDMAAAARGEKKQNSSGLPGKECQDFIKLPIEKQKELFKSGNIIFNAQKSDKVKPKLYEINK